MKKAIVILSGGMDSSTLLYKALQEVEVVSVLSFNYGQRHSLELDYAKKTCEKLDVNHKIIDLSSIKQVLGGSALTDDIEVPKGHYSAPSMALTVVPMRNAIMLSLATAEARSKGASLVYYGAHAGDHEIYWDCRERFRISFNDVIFDQAADSSRGSLSPEWVRAFWEGEGTLGRERSKLYLASGADAHGPFKPTVIFTQNDKGILEEVQKFFFGRGMVYFKNTHTSKVGILSDHHAYKLGGQNCRLFVDLMKNGELIKIETRRIQYDKWYARFEDYFTRPIHVNQGDKQYTIVQDGVEIVVPFQHMDKGDILILGKTLGVDYALTWTCYDPQDGNKACGKCGSCCERLEGFAKAGVRDPLPYVVELDESYGIKCSRCGATFYQSDPLDLNTQCGAC